MGKLATVFIILTMANLFLYPFLLAEPTAASDAARQEVEEAIGQYAEIGDDSVSFNDTAVKDSLPNNLDQNTIESGSTGLSYISGPNSIWDYIKLVFGFLVNIYFLLVKMGVPWLVSLFVALPTIILQIMGGIDLIRGFSS